MLSLSEVDHVLYLCTVYGYKHREIAEMFGVSRPVVSKRVSRSRKDLRRILIEKGILEGESLVG